VSLKNLDNLVKTGQLKHESYNQNEFIGLYRSGEARLIDAKLDCLSLESRFDLAYNSAHSLALAALRRHGYRANNRFIVFQVLPYTLNVGPEIWRVLSKCHDQRNLAEYEGYLDIDEQLLKELLISTNSLFSRISELAEKECISEKISQN